MLTNFLLINVKRIYHFEEYTVTCRQNSLCLEQGPVFRWNVNGKALCSTKNNAFLDYLKSICFPVTILHTVNLKDSCLSCFGNIGKEGVGVGVVQPLHVL